MLGLDGVGKRTLVDRLVRPDKECFVADFMCWGADDFCVQTVRSSVCFIGWLLCCSPPPLAC